MLEISHRGDDQDRRAPEQSGRQGERGDIESDAVAVHISCCDILEPTLDQRQARTPASTHRSRLAQIRDQWGGDRVVNTLLWEIARLRKSVRTLFARTITLYGYIPREIIVPDDPAVDRLIDAEPAITDDEAKKLAGYDSLLTESE